MGRMRNEVSFTCHYVFRGCITVSSHHTCRHVSFSFVGSIFSKSKIGEFGVVFLKECDRAVKQKSRDLAIIYIDQRLKYLQHLARC